MKTREIFQISVIIVLSSLLVFQISVNNGFEISKTSVTNVQSNQEASNYQSDIKGEINFAANDSIEKQSSDLTSLFKQVENSVVQITTKVIDTNSHIIINGRPFENQSTRLGSGFVYDTSGYIVTNNHVVDGAKTVDVTFVDGNTYSARVIGTDAHSDIAVLKITDDFTDEKLIPLAIGDSAILEVGEQVIAIGNPFGLSDTMTTGIVSQTGRLLPNQDYGFSIPDIIQTDAAINPGNSGGPLLNAKGQVIGLNTAIKSNTGDFAGIGFAIPSNTITRIIPILIKEGTYKHPWIGISGTNLTPDIANDLGLTKNHKGVLVSSVVEDGPAQRAGVVPATNENGKMHGGDIITAIDDHSIKGIYDIISYIEENKSVGDHVKLTVDRNGKIMDLSVILQERPAATN